MSSLCTTTSLTTTATATLHHHHVVGDNATTGVPSTTRGALSSQIEHEGHRLPQSTRSGSERYLFVQRRTYLVHHQRRAEHSPQPPPLLRTKTIPLPALADAPYSPPKVALEYDFRLPPITAHLPPNTKAHADH
jgi:hypothetical protein